MITLKVTRYYGNVNITKSRITIYDENTQNILFDGEARESRYCDYEKDERVVGKTHMCLGTGTYQLRMSPCQEAVMALVTHKEPTRRGFFILATNRTIKKEAMAQRMLIGYPSTGSAKTKILMRDEEAEESFSKILYDNLQGEFQLIVENKNVIEDW